jgi:hypothetical protein
VNPNRLSMGFVEKFRHQLGNPFPKTIPYLVVILGFAPRQTKFEYGLGICKIGMRRKGRCRRNDYSQWTRVIHYESPSEHTVIFFIGIRSTNFTIQPCREQRCKLLSVDR